MLASLDRDPELLLDEVAERGAAPAHEPVLVVQQLRVARLRARVRQQQRLQQHTHPLPSARRERGLNANKSAP